MIGSIWSRARNRLYDKGILTSVKADAFVISIGNLTWGGTGKTALAAKLGEFLIKNNFKVAIVSRGYGRKSTGLQVVSNGNSILGTWEDSGDEPMWLARKLPDAVVIVSESRVDAIHYLQSNQVDIIILDDAFQHRKVARDLDLLLIDAAEDLRKLHVLPFGKLREPLDGIRRASAVILTHSKNSDRETIAWAKRNSDGVLFFGDYAPKTQEFSGKRIAAFCGLGSPHHFYEMLSAGGAQLVFQQNFRDHHEYRLAELEDVQEKALKAGAEMLVTTGKDFIKIESVSFRMPFLVVEAELHIENQQEFFDFVISKIERRSDKVFQK